MFPNKNTIKATKHFTGLLFVPLFLSFLLFAGCKESNISSESEKTGRFDTIEIIRDPTFKNGIGLQGTNSAEPSVHEILRPFGSSASSPSWMLAQWASKYDLSGSPRQKESNGSITYSNESKKITLLAIDDSTTIFNMEVFASKEYIAPRKPGQNWPGLLLAQQFDHQLHLISINALWLKMDARLMYASNKMGNAYNPSIHTAQFTVFLTIQNKNSSSSDYGDFFWFGLPLYDYRHKNISHAESKDFDVKGGFGSGKFIYDVAGNKIYTGSFHDRKWKHVNVDIYPLITKAFKTAKEKGYLQGSNFNDMVISSMNLGWEMPGTFDAGFQFKHLYLIAITKQ